jgi:hypothetical protein
LSPKLVQVDRTPDDEILLTELTYDAKDIITYEVSSVILVAEQQLPDPNGRFRCFMEVDTKEFFIEIPDEKTMSAFNRSALLSLLDLAEEAGAKAVFMCVRKTVKDQERYLRNFLFVGFERLTEKEQRKISMTRTHAMLKYSLRSNEESSDE